MRVLITGGSGFVGSHVAKQLLTKGHEVRLLVRDTTKAKALFTGSGVQYPDKLPEFVCADITDKAAVARALDGCDALVHAAAATPMNINSTQALYEVNVGGTRNVIGAATDLGLRAIVYVSSITAIFNTDASKVTADAALVAAQMPYGKSKVQAEQYVRQLQADGHPISIVYPSGIVGPDDPGFSDAMKALQYRIDQGFRIFKGGGMQHIDVRDLAAFIVSCLEQGGSGRFLLPGPYLSWEQLADIIEAVSGCRLNRIPAKGWQLRLIGRLIDILRLFKPVSTPVSAETMRYATLWPKIDNSPALAQRGLRLRDPEETFRDSIQWLLSAGYLQPEQVPTLETLVQSG